MAQGRCALVTGATRGIGRAVALRLAQDGYAVAGCYRAESEYSDKLRVELDRLGVPAYLAPCDVADPTAVEEFFTAAEDALGPVAVLVSNAGVTRDSPLVLM